MAARKLCSIWPFFRVRARKIEIVQLKMDAGAAPSEHGLRHVSLRLTSERALPCKANYVCGSPGWRGQHPIPCRTTPRAAASSPPHFARREQAARPARPAEDDCNAHVCYV